MTCRAVVIGWDGEGTLGEVRLESQAGERSWKVLKAEVKEFKCNVDDLETRSRLCFQEDSRLRRVGWRDMEVFMRMYCWNNPLWYFRT